MGSGGEPDTEDQACEIRRGYGVGRAGSGCEHGRGVELICGVSGDVECVVRVDACISKYVAAVSVRTGVWTPDLVGVKLIKVQEFCEVHERP